MKKMQERKFYSLFIDTHELADFILRNRLVEPRPFDGPIPDDLRVVEVSAHGMTQIRITMESDQLVNCQWQGYFQFRKVNFTGSETPTPYPSSAPNSPP